MKVLKYSTTNTNNVKCNSDVLNISKIFNDNSDNTNKNFPDLVRYEFEPINDIFF